MRKNKPKQTQFKPKTKPILTSQPLSKPKQSQFKPPSGTPYGAKQTQPVPAKAPDPVFVQIHPLLIYLSTPLPATSHEKRAMCQNA